LRPRYGERAEAAAGVYDDAGRQTISPHRSPPIGSGFLVGAPPQEYPKVRFGGQPGRAEVAKFNRRGHRP